MSDLGDSRKSGKKSGQPALQRGSSQSGQDCFDVESTTTASADSDSRKVLTCGMCLGTSLDPNPCPNRHRGPTLNFANKSECLACRNYCNSSVRNGLTRSDLKTQMENDAGKRGEFCASRSEYIILFDSSSGSQLRNLGEKIVLPQFVRLQEEESASSKTFQGVFWPIEVLKREKIHHEESELATYKAQRGILRKTKDGMVAGCIEVWSESKQNMVKSKELGNSKYALASDLDSCWKATTAKMQRALPTYAESETESGSVSLHPVDFVQPTLPMDCATDWDDGILPCLAFASAAEADPCPTPESKGKRKNAASGSEGGRQNKSRKDVAPRATQQDEGKVAAAKAKTAKPKAPAKVTGKVAAKVYPSQQQRCIVAAEQTLATAKALVEAAQDDEGLHTLSVSKLSTAMAAVSKKLAGDNAAVLLAHHTTVLEGGGKHDLHERGTVVVESLGHTLDLLTLIKDLVASLACDDKTSLEFSPSFLLRAYEDATSGGVKIASVLPTVIRRHVTTLMEEGNHRGAICCLDKNLDLRIGIACLKSRPEVMEKTQTELACVITETLMLDLQSDVPQSLASFAEAMCDLKKVLESNKELQDAFGHIECMASMAKRASEDVAAAVQACGPNGSAPERIQRMFSSGPGKSIYVGSKQHILQMQVDAHVKTDLTDVRSSVMY